jgi:UV DNA damage endonuclease
VLRHLGYVAIALAIESATNRTCRLKNATPDRLRALIEGNLCELGRVLAYNVEQGIFLYRASSEMIPFASHPVNAVPWWEEHAERFARMGELIRSSGQRVTMHPGQFTVLNSPRAEVVKSAIEELAWHVRLLDALGTGPASKIILHVGGTFGDKAAAMARFASVAADLPEGWRARIVIENDEHQFGPEDVLELSAKTGLPMVYDNLHDLVYSKRDDGPSRHLRDVFATWKGRDGGPKVHYSEQAEGGRVGAHSDRIAVGPFLRFLEQTPEDIPFDVMLECKHKDLALRQLRADLAARGVVEAGRAAAVAQELALR